MVGGQEGREDERKVRKEFRRSVRGGVGWGEGGFISALGDFRVLRRFPVHTETSRQSDESPEGDRYTRDLE